MNSSQKSILKNVAERFFIGNPVKISQKREGQLINENRDFVLGCYAGPEQDISNLFHEMSHLAEREIDKLILRPFSSWGFTFGKYWELLGHSGFEPQTEQSVLREARVWAYQASILKEYKVDFTFSELVGSAVYFPAFCYFKFKRTQETSKDRELEALSILATMVERQSEVFTFQEFEKNWNLRMVALKNS